MFKASLMKNRIYLLLLLFIGLLSHQLAAQPFVTPALQEVLSEKEEEAFISVNMRFDAQYDDQLLYRESRSIRSREARREFVVDELKAFSQQQQAGLLTYLKEMEDAGKVKEIRPLWITNLVNAKVRPSVIQELLTRKDLNRLDYNQMHNMIMAGQDLHDHSEAENDNTATVTLAWNVTHINADQVWDQGNTGEDVGVAVLDTGINYDHHDISDNMWEHPDYPNHGYNFYNNSHETMDDSGHGTHCAGTVAGTGAAGTCTGIAPGATIMNLKVLNFEGYGTEAGMWAGIQFAIDYGAHIMSLSLGIPQPFNPDFTTWRNVMNNALNAGLIAAVAAGNEAGGDHPLYPDIPYQVRVPGNIPPPWLHPDQELQGGISSVVTVGATDNMDTIASFSSRGPVTWQEVTPFYDYPYDPGMGLTKPDIVGPGVSILSLSHNNNTGYATYSGTSMANPAVAGVMALMLSKNPELLPEEINQILEETALQITENKSNTYGSGRVDALAAVLATPGLFIRCIDHTVVDETGNNDGKINPGETIQFNLVMENRTPDGVDDVFVALSSESEYITITDSLALIGDFQPDELITVEHVFVVEVADGIPGNYIIDFVLSAYSSHEEDQRWISRFAEMAHAPYLAFSNLQILDQEKNKNQSGSLEPGEDAFVQIDIANTGQLPSTDVKVFMESENEMLTVLTYEGFDMPPINPGDTVAAILLVNSFPLMLPETIVEVVFKAQTGAHEFVQAKEIIIGEFPTYTGGDIPTTLKTNVTTQSNALEPGSMSLIIPEGAVITGVDVQYKMHSQTGAWMNEQRSFLRCVSDGGETEASVSFGTGSSGGTLHYERTGLDIANNVEGGGEITFELHAFRTWGGSGSGTQFVHVPNNTWKIYIYYELPGYPVTFIVENQFDERVEDATVNVSGITAVTNQQGEAIMDLPKGFLYHSVAASSHRAIWFQGFDVIPGENLVEVSITKVFEAVFNVTNSYGDEITHAIITLQGESLNPGHYHIGDLEDGVYQYTIEADAHLPHEGMFEIIDQNIQINVVLQPDGTSLSGISEDEFRIFPNPAQTMVHIHSTREIRDLRLVNIMGQVIYTTRVQGFEYNLNVSSLENGIYLLQVLTNNGNKTKRLQISN